MLLPFDWGTEAITFDSVALPMADADVSYGSLWMENARGLSAFRQKSVKIQEALNTQRNEKFSKVQNAIALIVQKYAKQHGYNLVMMNDGVIYADSGLDLTPAILQILKAAPAK